MPKLFITNRSTFDSQVRAWMKSVEQAAEVVAKGLAFHMLDVILQNSPQYSGDFAANWNMSVGVPNYEFTPGTQGHGAHKALGVYEPVARQGSPGAITRSMGRARVALGDFRLGQTIWLANGAYHDESYAVLIEENRIQFRPENPSGGRVVARAVQHAALFRSITKESAIRLARLGGV